MDSVFVKRYPSKGEFPHEDLLIVLTKNGKMFTFDVTNDTEWWLEEVQLLTEGEINKLKPLPDDSVVSVYDSGFYNGVNFILEKLKGGKNG